MPTEIEIKIKVADLASMRHRLNELAAADHGAMLEVNTFFDRPDESLRRADCGLRLRTETPLVDAPGGSGSPASALAGRATITYKGARNKSEMRSREEYNLAVDPAPHAAAILEALGFVRTISFEKRRHTWHMDDCEVVLDELPHFGTFVEIEGPSEAAVRAVQARLGMAEQPGVADTYIKMMVEYVRTHDVPNRSVTFANVAK
jgi:adenylate cyclase class IV